MKPSFSSSLSVFSLLLGTLAIVGCGGALTASNPGLQWHQAIPLRLTVVAGPAINGSVFGGHAPVEGAHVYLLQPGTTGYGSLATSLLGTGTNTSPGGYTLTVGHHRPQCSHRLRVRNL